VTQASRKLVAILFTDVVGYTTIVGTDEAAGVAARDKHRRLVQTLVAQFHGTFVEETGDESLSTFPSSVDAVSCALALQGVLENDPELSIRIGIHIGDVLERDGRLIGDAVNLAARLRPLAEPGGVCVSERVFEDVRNHPEIETTFVGEHELKNVERPVRVYAVSRVRKGKAARRPGRRRVRARALGAVAGVFLLAGVGYLARDAILGLLIRYRVFTPWPSYEQTIAFTTSRDGTRIAWSSAGTGPPVLIVLGWATHLERGHFSPGFNPYAPPLLGEHRVITYDGRGFGLSDRGVADMSLEARVADLEAVVAAAGLERFGLLGISAGGPASIRYAAEHPERVTRLAFFGSFARMSGVPGLEERWRSVVPVVRLGWGQENPAFRQMFTSQFMPDGSEAIWAGMNETFRQSASAEDAANFISTMIDFDVTPFASRIRAPTLVVHARGDVIVPFEQGREIAALIPGARIHVLETNNHAFGPFEPANEDFAAVIRAFFAEDLP
jgi:class 3 adenylate cyclase/pimeloyl-ACP methyl ester carboxylesterase